MLVCSQCRAKNAATAKFCESCGASLTDVREADDATEQILLWETRRGVWALGIVTVVQVITVLMVDPSDYALWLIAGVFAALALWAVRAPLIASAVGLGIFVVLHGLEAVIDPSSLLRGVLLKVGVVALLLGALKAGLAHRNFQRERRGE